MQQEIMLQPSTSLQDEVLKPSLSCTSLQNEVLELSNLSKTSQNEKSLPSSNTEQDNVIDLQEIISQKPIIKSYNNVEPFKVIIPKGYRILKEILDKLNSNARILIVDDIDADGFGSAKICVEKLSKIFSNCKVKINHQHGFVDLDEAEGYDLIIILDSSSMLIETYKGLGQVIVIDHHEYDHSLQCPPNLLLINSKDTEGLESISAGMLTYILFSEYLKDRGIADWDALFDVACMTLYSDIVPLDPFVQQCIKRFTQMTSHSDIINTLNIYHEPVNKNTLSYNIIPLINYTRRLNDTYTLNLLYQNKEDVAVQYLIENKKTGRKIFDIFDTTVEIDKSYGNFIFADISFAVENVNMFYPLHNFKGVYANKLSERYGLPVVVGYVKDEKYFISVRSNGIDSLSYFEKHVLSGGGHGPACGFEFYEYDKTVILSGYSQYLKDYKIKKPEIVDLGSIRDLDFFDLYIVALDNEFRYSNYKPTSYRIKNIPYKELKNLDYKKNMFTINNYAFKSYKPLPVDKEQITLIITPTLISPTVKTKQLIVEFE